MSDLDFTHHFNQSAKGNHRSYGPLHDIMCRRFKRHATVNSAEEEKFKRLLQQQAGQIPPEEIDND